MSLVKETLGSLFDRFSYLPLSESRGGILLAWNSSRVSCNAEDVKNHSITVEVSLPGGYLSCLTVVYGPLEDVHKPTFLHELHDIHCAKQRFLDYPKFESNSSS